MSAAADSPQQGIQSIEVGAQVLRALEADGLADALCSTAGKISTELGYRPA
jgi:hypothetical protein